ncbi:MAG: xanthine dehydrogenase family protein subunit M [Mesorhizobium sp.]|nr:xanthine dehydrogenase family protein subunit M [Mesorhizobium sp.]MBL8576368.1 xanthine dehydrogenase family protein subunit M [Mesorhizobium sp.]
MKPPLFDYLVARSSDEAIRLLSDNPGAMILAGGQSLIPAMNFRLASPSALIDISRIAALKSIDIVDGNVRVGAAVKHRDLEQSDAAFAVNPLMRTALHYVAHVPIRNRGTTVGSLCHADAAAEMPMILLLSDGWVMAEGPNGQRKIPAAEFFEFHMTTTREADEMIVSATFPALPSGAGYAFAEFARRKGDYAVAAVGAILECDLDGRVAAARLAACGIASRPIRLFDVEASLVGANLSDAEIDAAGELAKEAVTAPDDANATTAYRQHLLASLTRRVIREASEKVRKG